MSKAAQKSESKNCAHATAEPWSSKCLRTCTVHQSLCWHIHCTNKTNVGQNEVIKARMCIKK